MAVVTFITFYGLFMVVCAIIAAVVAKRKNRDVSAWVAWTFIIPPALCILLCLGRKQGPRPRRRTMDEEDAMMDSL